MRFLVILWVAVEVLQVAVIALLAFGYRDLRRQLRQTRSFEEGPPPSITEG